MLAQQYILPSHSVPYTSTVYTTSTTFVQTSSSIVHSLLPTNIRTRPGLTKKYPKGSPQEGGRRRKSKKKAVPQICWLCSIVQRACLLACLRGYVLPSIASSGFSASLALFYLALLCFCPVLLLPCNYTPHTWSSNPANNLFPRQPYFWIGFFWLGLCHFIWIGLEHLRLVDPHRDLDFRKRKRQTLLFTVTFQLLI